MLPTREIVGLTIGPETIEKSGIHDGLEIDLVTHDAKKFFEMLLKKNGYVLEQVLSPLVMRTGEIEANLLRLNETAKLPYIGELVERKVTGEEKSRLSDADFEFHSAEFQRLLAELEAARDRSTLPESPRSQPALHDLLVRLRLGAMRSAGTYD